MGQVTIKLSDLGSAKEIRNNVNSMIGSAGWIAPEVLENFGNYERFADIWSLGITVYEMLKGISPFETNNQFKTMKNIL